MPVEFHVLKSPKQTFSGNRESDEGRKGQQRFWSEVKPVDTWREDDTAPSRDFKTSSIPYLSRRATRSDAVTFASLITHKSPKSAPPSPQFHAFDEVRNRCRA
jgi:hypothetical protein